MEICARPGCGRRIHSDGLCASHYRREYRAKDTGHNAEASPIRPYGQNSRQVSCRLPEEVYEALEAEAKPLGLKVYGLVQRVIMDHVRRKN